MPCYFHVNDILINFPSNEVDIVPASSHKIESQNKLCMETGCKWFWLLGRLVNEHTM